MCGLIFAHGPNAASIVNAGLKKIAHRGPDAQRILKVDEIYMGFVHLSITGSTDHSKQPHVYGSLTGVFNAEIYNHTALKQALDCTDQSSPDTTVILPLFAQDKETLLQRLDGFYSGIIYDRHHNKLFTLRDPIGKKPLFLVCSDRDLILTSELKSCPNVDRFQVIPAGLCEIDLQSGSIQHHNALPSSPTKPMSLRAAMTTSVNKRIHGITPVRFGVFLSGGLDSSIIASLVHRSSSSKDARYYYFDDSQSKDTEYALKMLEYLQIPNYQITPVSVPQENEIGQLIKDVVYHTESYNPSIISNGIGTYILSQRAHQDGLKVVLGGDGADEVFCGYFDHARHDDWQETRRQLLNDLHVTELRRIDGAAMAHAIEVRCPFLDRDVIQIADQMGYDDLYGPSGTDCHQKKALRKAFSDILPTEISQRRKVSFDLGTGIQRQVIMHCKKENISEKEYLLRQWQQHFSSTLSACKGHPYFWSYPAFDKFSDRRANKHE